MKKTNVVLIVIDDMGWRDLQCFGSSFYETPNIDTLAMEGTVLTQAYASCPVCSPSRASLMTGKYPARLGLTHYLGGFEEGKLLSTPYMDHLPLDEYTLPKAFRDQGYHTWHLGKWHLGEEPFFPEHQGFEVNIGGCNWGRPPQGYYSPWGIDSFPSDVPDGVYLTDYITERAVELITDSDNKPFFMYLSHYALHTPIEAKPDDITHFQAKYARMKLDQINPFVEGERFPTLNKKNERVKRRLIQSDVTYAAMIRNLDWNIGRVIAALKKKNLYDNTIIVLTSDNGGLSTAEGSPTSNSPLSEGKGWMYEGGIRVPFIIAGPKIPKRMISTQPMTSPDIYPTLLELADIPLHPEQHCDGNSLANILQQKAPPKDYPLFWHFPHYGNQGGTPAAAVRLGTKKLIYFFEDNHAELYDLSVDLSESIDLSKELPEETLYLKTLLLKWLNKMEAKIPQPNPHYEKFSKTSNNGAT